MVNAQTPKNNLAHSRAAYLHAVRALPSPDGLQAGPIRQNGMVFSREDQIFSQLIELGWAFFPRYEGCLERWLKNQNVRLSKKFSLTNWLANQNIDIPSSYAQGLDVYRKIRNVLHHDDGASFDGSQGKEIHLFPEQMENFFDLFCWIGLQVEKSKETPLTD